MLSIHPDKRRDCKTEPQYFEVGSDLLGEFNSPKLSGVWAYGNINLILDKEVSCYQRVRADDKDFPKEPQTRIYQHYAQAKTLHPGVMIALRVGDFFEFYGTDATLAADICGLTLTKREAAKDSTDPTLPMCGMPYHSVERYLAKLLNAGWKCALATWTNEQLTTELREPPPVPNRWTHRFPTTMEATYPYRDFTKARALKAGLPMQDSMKLDALEREAEYAVLRGQTVVSGYHNDAHQRQAIVPLRWGAPRVLVTYCGHIQAMGADYREELFRAARLWRYAFDPNTDLVLSRKAPQDEYPCRPYAPSVDALVLDFAGQVGDFESS